MPAEAGKAAEVVVVGVQFSIVLNGKSSNVGVSGELTANICSLKNPSEEGEVTCGGDQFCDVRVVEPSIDKA